MSFCRFQPQALWRFVALDKCKSAVLWRHLVKADWHFTTCTLEHKEYLNICITKTFVNLERIFFIWFGLQKPLLQLYWKIKKWGPVFIVHLFPWQSGWSSISLLGIFNCFLLLNFGVIKLTYALFISISVSHDKCVWTRPTGGNKSSGTAIVRVLFWWRLITFNSI